MRKKNQSLGTSKMNGFQSISVFMHHFKQKPQRDGSKTQREHEPDYQLLQEPR
ncbi:hypothetical protein AG1IA_01058 [Rhizoctonia solani AG-1 IA]|uniref:Uncharacterized protein n=1 Tax=Thanatephorus cucumeris (strain AG1-IA) TaxID=983506 RepID=L8X788_THACA|nr:hypothetical protein AG1IA_01058 [Rhizoctonia solani AG-1 IA]